MSVLAPRGDLEDITRAYTDKYRLSSRVHPFISRAEAVIAMERSTYHILRVGPGPGVPEAERLYADNTSPPEDLGKSEASCAVGPGCGWTAVDGTKCP